MGVRRWASTIAGFRIAILKGLFLKKPVFGASGEWSLWNPHVDADIEFSSARIQVVGHDDQGKPVEAITAGWMVNKKLFGDSSTRFFVHFRNKDNKEGCFNAMRSCPGFVLSERGALAGSPLQIYNQIKDGPPNYLKVDIKKEKNQWWVYMNDWKVGHWPEQLFTYLRHGAKSTNYGGEVYNSSPGGRHTRTAMGNGEFPEKQKNNYRKVACFKHWEYYNGEGKKKSFFWQKKVVEATNKNCYSAVLKSGKNGFCFGGSGYNQNCQH